MMPNFGQKVSAKSDLVPEWTSQEVSTGVSTRAVGAGWTEPDPVLFLWRVFKYKQRLNETALLQRLTAANASKLVLIVKLWTRGGTNRTEPDWTETEELVYNSGRSGTSRWTCSYISSLKLLDIFCPKMDPAGFKSAGSDKYTLNR